MRTINVCLCVAFLNVALAASHLSLSAEEQPVPNRNSCKSADDCQAPYRRFPRCVETASQSALIGPALKRNAL